MEGTDQRARPSRARRLLPPSLLVGALGLAAVAAGCTSPSINAVTLGCGTASQQVVKSISARLTVKGSLRNVSTIMVKPTRAGELVFVSGEFLRRGQAHNADGQILTWGTPGPATGQFQSVDSNARTMSAWPGAPYGLEKAGAVASRGCTDTMLGKTPSACGGAQVPGGFTLRCPGG